MAASVYFGVWCRGCKDPMPLVELISGPRNHQWILPRVPPFDIQCYSCRECQQYTRRDLMVFEAELSAEFNEHRAFRNV